MTLTVCVTIFPSITEAWSNLLMKKSVQAFTRTILRDPKPTYEYKFPRFCTIETDLSNKRIACSPSRRIPTNKGN